MRAITEDHSATEFPVTINCLNPGLCHSELAHGADGLGFFFVKLSLARSTEHGSRTLIHAGSQGAEPHGQYLSDCKITEPHSVVTSKEGQVVQDRVGAELMK